MALVALCGGPAYGQVSIALDAKPQYSSNSCRSYGLALAMGTLPGTQFPIVTAKQLRALEQAIQSNLSSAAQKLGASASDHQIWRQVVEQMSSGNVELVLEYPKTIEAFYTRVRKLTGVENADTLGTLFALALNKTAVMTSVIRVGKDKYGSGHIVTVYGLSARQVTPTPMVMLNPAVKVADARRNACEIGDVPNDERWSAITSLEPSYELKSFETGYLLMWLRRKGAAAPAAPAIRSTE